MIIDDCIRSGRCLISIHDPCLFTHCSAIIPICCVLDLFLTSIYHWPVSLTRFVVFNQLCSLSLSLTVISSLVFPSLCFPSHQSRIYIERTRSIIIYAIVYLLVKHCISRLPHSSFHLNYFTNAGFVLPPRPPTL